ncbi:hypothetical protein ASD21_21935 [Caulobacter sp. Root1455]|uniref:hypothetical protein n=1 Tax=Caulobacter sp. Root1455 TaxID=1736465 RepID=UPI0006F28578|nr:hypothetical protein [Caulobacter sp. Root1455]KQZ02777.1 hypothetical protein ASD21_21935 [Caulobacter sp. Root1455]
MSDLSPSEFHEDVYAHPLISWGAVIAGVAVAIALGALLNMLGLAIGATAANPWTMDSGDAKALTIGGGLWVAFSNAVALQVGAYIAARAAKYPDHHRGLFQGLAVWGVAFVLAFAGLGSSVGGILHGGDAAVEAYATAADEVSGPDDRISDADAKAAAEQAGDATASLAWWGVATMVLGAIGAVAGGRLGARHPVWFRRARVVVTSV